MQRYYHNMYTHARTTHTQESIGSCFSFFFYDGLTGHVDDIPFWLQIKHRAARFPTARSIYGVRTEHNCLPLGHINKTS